MADGNSNGSMTKSILMWIIGLIGTLFVLSITFYTSTLSTHIDTIERRLNDMSISISQVKESFRQVDDLTKATRVEQVDRTFRFGDLTIKISNIDTKLQLLDERYKSLSDRVTSIANRLERLPRQPSTQEPSLYSPVP